MSDIPTILKGPYQEDYHRQLNEVLIDSLSNNGWTIPPLSAAEVAIVTSYTFERIMPVFTLWGNTDIGKLQFISVAANPLTSTNATIETINSA